MTGLRRIAILGLALSSPFALAVQADEVSDTFAQGVDLVEQGLKEDALVAFKKVLALDPDQEAIFQLWLGTDAYVWSDMLAAIGRHLRIDAEQRCSYLFRYFAPHEPLMHEVQHAEARAITRGSIVAIGARCVATRA